MVFPRPYGRKWYKVKNPTPASNGTSLIALVAESTILYNC